MRSIAVLAILLAFPAVAPAQDAPPVVKALSFEGNRAIDDLTLATAIATTNSSWFARSKLVSWLPGGTERTFNETNFRGDVLRIWYMYRASGFPDVTVDTLVERSPGEVRLKFLITEGEPVRVASFEIAGLESVAERPVIVRDLRFGPGDVFSQYVLSSVLDTLTSRLNNTGYPSAVVDGTFDSDSVSRTARIAIRITPGARAAFGPVRVEGDSKVDTAFIRSLVPARPDQPFRLDLLAHAQRTLYGTDLFRYATVTIDTTGFSVGDSVVPLVVNVTDGRVHRATGSVGFATNDCLRTTAGWTARNFLGTGRVVSLNGRLSKIGVASPLGFGAEESICSALKSDTVGSREVNYSLSADLRRYGFLSADNLLTFSLFSERRSEYRIYQREEVGVGVSLTRETAKRIPITISYRLSYGATEANPVSFCQFFNACVAEDVARLRQRRVSSTLSLSFLRQRVNNILDPSRGTILSAEATIATKALGSSELEQFTRLVGEAAAFIPLARSVVLAGRLRGGLIFAPEVNLAGGSANFVPPAQRFYAGGSDDVRGYDHNELGPVVYVVPRDSLYPDFNPSNARVAATGGDRVAIANLELRFPSPVLSQRLRFVAFLDAGALWAGRGTGKLRFTPGFGTRFTSPLGPVRFDFGYNSYQLESGPVFTNTENGDLEQIADDFARDRRRDWTIHFSIGHAF